MEALIDGERDEVRLTLHAPREGHWFQVLTRREATNLVRDLRAALEVKQRAAVAKAHGVTT